MKLLTLDNVGGARGAPMGRTDSLPDDLDSVVDLLIAKLRWVDGDYDQAGAYWGGGDGDDIYCAYGEDDEVVIEIFVRAKDFEDAKRRILVKVPNAKIEIGQEAVSVRGESIDDFVVAYLTAALWASTDDDGKPLDAEHTIEDFSLEAIQEAKTDCERFQSENADDIRDANYNSAGYSDAEMAGHDFFLSRNGHGTGYWDRELGDIGDRLTEAAKSFGEANPYIGDDELIHF